MIKKNMEQNPFQKGIQSIREVKLSPEDKQAVLSRLLAHVEESRPVSAVRRTRFFESFVRAFGHVAVPRLEYALAGMLIMVLAGGSVVSAAEGALPGDLLYPIKIDVTEPIIGAFSVNDLSRAQWEAEKTVRRLEEAETLAAQGRLNPSAAEVIKDNFGKSASEFNTIVQSPSARTPLAALVDARVDFEAKMNAHSQILSAIEHAAVENEGNDIAALRGAVEESVRQVRTGRMSAAETLLKGLQEKDKTTGTNSGQGPVESGEGARAPELFNDKVQSVQAIIQDTKDRLEDTATSTATASSTVQGRILEIVPQTLKTAENALKDAKEKQDSGDPVRAFSALLDSESAAKQAETSLQRGLKFGEGKPEDQTSSRSTSSDGSSRERDNGD